MRGMPLVELVLLHLAAAAVGGTPVRLTPLALPILPAVVGLAASFLSPFEGIRINPELDDKMLREIEAQRRARAPRGCCDRAAA